MTRNNNKQKKEAGRLVIISSNCPYCGHRKAFYNLSYGKKCTRCKEKYM